MGGLCYNPRCLKEVIQLFVYLNIVQIIISIILIVVVLLQSRGEGFTGTFGTESSVFRTRRGIEKTLFQFTIVLGIIFILVSIISVLVSRGVVTS